MKTKQLIIGVLLIVLMTSVLESTAQRRVVSTPRRTVVQIPRGSLFTGNSAIFKLNHI